MATHDQLQSVYDDLLPVEKTASVLVLVVPLIRYQYKNSDYLYLLYKPLIEDSKTYKVVSLSVWKHWKMVWKALTKKNLIVHYHWLECTDLKSLAGMIYKWTFVWLYSHLGGKLVWTIHNKMPHDGKYQRLNYRLRSSLAKRADRLTVHCGSVIEDLSRFYHQPEEKFRVVQHPPYPSREIPGNEARKKLLKKWPVPIRKEDQLFLMFGNISSYKNIDRVGHIFKKLPTDKKLLVVGPVKKGQMHYYHQISNSIEGAKNIKVIPHFVPEEMVPVYFSSADCVLFNFDEILTSGGVVLAKSYNKPIIAPNLGCLTELDPEADKATLFETEEQLEYLIRNFRHPEPKDG